MRRADPAARVTAERAGPPVALYVHVPFCLSLCPYCDFVVVAGAAARGPRARIDPFLAAIRTEVELRADAADRRFGSPGLPGSPTSPGRGPLETLYLGGGTPSLLPADAIAGLIELVRERFGLARDAEVTLEANPGPDDRGDPTAQRRAGVTRLSIGAQSLAAAELRTLGRRHRARDVAAAVEAARAAAIGSISLDLLYDVPGQTIGSWMTTLDEALALGPDHLSAYALTLDDPDAEGLTGPLGDHLPTQPGARRWRAAARGQQDEDRAAAMYHHAIVRLRDDGWLGYEISNWARPGHESRHNLVYWERRPYEAVGPGAHAFDGVERRWNAARLDAYIAALAPPAGRVARLPPGGAETIDTATATSERLILGLRTARGIPSSAMREPPLDEVAAWAVAAELLELVTQNGERGRQAGERLRLTTRGRLLSNELFARLV
ncbi:MAG: coproporphyrinogen-III oxidase family protein [Candidatus Limnocylindrales bacterium]